MDEAVLRLREALAGSSPDDPRRLHIEARNYQMQRLAGMVRRRTGSALEEFTEELDGVTQRALGSIPGGNKTPRHKCLSELANALEIRYAAGGDFRIEEIDEAVTLRQEALSIVPTDHRDFGPYRSRGAHTIQLRSIVTGVWSGSGSR